MKKWVTEIIAIDHRDGLLKKWIGPYVPGITIEDAMRYCNENGLGYCVVTGQLKFEVLCKENSIEADFTKIIDFDNLN